MSYLPDRLGQYQPVTTYSAVDCVPDGAALCVNRATVDALRPTHADIRRASNVTTRRGLSYNEAAQAALSWSKARGRAVHLEPSFANSRDTMRDTIAGGEACGVSIDTSVTIRTSRRTNYYVGGHTVFALRYQYHPAGDTCDCEKRIRTAHGEFLVDDPGTTAAGFLWWSADLLYRAAEARGYGKINLLVAPDTEGVTWRAVKDSQIRTLPSYSEGKSVGRLRIGGEYEGGRTQKGGNWKRADGTYGDGWVHILKPDGWSKGRALVAA